MRLLRLKKIVLASLVGFFALIGINSANAQTVREYNDWQRAQREAQREYQEYLRTRDPRDYREWQQAQRDAQREYRDYQAERLDDVRDNRRDMNRSYRIYRNGSYYNTDYRGAEILRQAVNRGYQQGYREGQMDRRYGRGGNYYGSSTYRSGTYGYQSYVARNHYEYYFQQGFQRGYEDGYNSQMRYGDRSGNNFNILGNILSTILTVTNN